MSTGDARANARSQSGSVLCVNTVVRAPLPLPPTNEASCFVALPRYGDRYRSVAGATKVNHAPTMISSHAATVNARRAIDRLAPLGTRLTLRRATSAQNTRTKERKIEER